MPEAWSPEEVAATVADYFVMLEHQFRGESFNKSEHRRRLQAILHNRSEQAVEFKHCNISAILIEIGFPVLRQCFADVGVRISRAVGVHLAITTWKGDAITARSTRSYDEPHIAMPTRVTDGAGCPG